MATATQTEIATTSAPATDSAPQTENETKTLTQVIVASLRGTFDAMNLTSQEGKTLTVRKGSIPLVKITDSEGNATSIRLYVSEGDMFTQDEHKKAIAKVKAQLRTGQAKAEAKRAQEEEEDNSVDEASVLFGRMLVIYDLGNTWGAFTSEDLRQNFGWGKIEQRPVLNALVECGSLEKTTRGRSESYKVTDVKPTLPSEKKKKKSTGARGTHTPMDTEENRAAILAQIEGGNNTAKGICDALFNGDRYSVVFKVVKRMESEGLLSSTKEGRSVTYTVNEVAPSQEEVVGTAPEVVEPEVVVEPEEAEVPEGLANIVEVLTVVEEAIQVGAKSTADPDSLEEVQSDAIAFIASKGKAGATFEQVHEFFGKETFNVDQMENLLGMLVEDNDVSARKMTRNKKKVVVYKA